MAAPAKSSTGEESVDQIQERAKARKAAPGLTPQQIDDLQQTYRDVAHATDDDGKSIKRAVLAKLRRVTHGELHPGCGATGKVTMTVPRHPTGAFYTINEVPYFGAHLVWPCEARQLAHMIETARQVERERMREAGRVIDLDTPIASRVVAQSPGA
jgi:hypothetical protein